ncbi:MAG: LuxR C-terminal-related transcriptional regulator [Terracidiphilus sp.]
MKAGHQIKPIRTELTARERLVDVLFQSGKTMAEISGLLGISVHTVHRHRDSIRQKRQDAYSLHKDVRRVS